MIDLPSSKLIPTAFTDSCVYEHLVRARAAGKWFAVGPGTVRGGRFGRRRGKSTKEKSGMRKLSSAVIILAFAAAGCTFNTNLPPPQSDGDTRPQISILGGNLSPGQVRGVLQCQATIKFAAAAFGDFKEFELDECFDEVLQAQLNFENAVTTSNAFSQQLTRIRQDCAQDYKEVGAASTGLVNSIVRACQPVQSLILPVSGYDPLEFGALARALSISLTDNAVELAGEICGARELLVDGALATQVPRMVGLLNTLDQGTGQFEITGPSSSLLSSPIIPNIPLDSRCTFPPLP
jgi:hypothetical protein